MSLGSSNWDVNVQKFDASGLVGGVVQLQASSGATDLYPQVTAVGTNGEYMVTWYGYASGISGYHLFVQKFNADGSTHENLVVLNHDGHATVQSTESGTIYLVNDNVVVSQLSDITGAASNQWASTTVTANTSATISAANLAEGTTMLMPSMRQAIFLLFPAAVCWWTTPYLSSPVLPPPPILPIALPSAIPSTPLPPPTRTA
jgi:hypothetical protein